MELSLLCTTFQNFLEVKMNLEENNYDYIAGSNFGYSQKCLLVGKGGTFPPPACHIFEIKSTKFSV